MQSRPESVDLTALPPAHRSIFQGMQTGNDELRATVELLTDTNRCWNISSASCAGRSTTRSPRSARWTIANWRSRTWRARWPRPRKPRLRRAPQQPRPPPSAVPRAASICPGALSGSSTSSSPRARVSLRVRGHDPHRRGPHRSGWTSCRRNCGHRHGATEVRLPTCAGRDPGRRARRTSSRAGCRPRGRWRRCSFPVRRSSSAVPSIAIYARSGVELHRSTLEVGKASFHRPRWWIGWPGT